MRPKHDYSADCSMSDKYIDTIDQEHSGNLQCDLPYTFSMDTVVNTSGTKLIEICLCSDLKLVNGRKGDDAGIGSYTFMSPNVTLGHSELEIVESYKYLGTCFSKSGSFLAMRKQVASQAKRALYLLY